MRTKIFLSLLGVALATTVACGDDTDPSKNSSTNVQTNNTSTSANNTSSNNTSSNNTTTSGNNTSTSANNTSTNNTTPNNTATCDAPDPSFFGQIGADAPGGGGAPDVGGTYDTDANLQAVFDAMPAEEGDTPVTLDTPITVTDALVVSTGFIPNGATSPARFWVQDSNIGLEAFLSFDFESPVAFATGMIVSFDVTAVQNFGGNAQISEITNVTMTSDGNLVPVIDASARALTPDDLGQIVKLGGTLPATSTGCGGDSVCYELDYGNGTVTFRTDSQFIEPGSCVTFVGPLRSFPGPIGNTLTAGDLQVDQINYGWARTPR